MNVQDYPQLIEEALRQYLPSGEYLQKKLFDAMGYGLLGGGKRIRPTLVLEFCRVCGGSQQAAMPFACALEMVHSYSLIHDDLPCMDNDDMRRGKPSNHKVYGEDLALLAGDGLLTLAFETMLSPQAVSLAGSDRAAAAAGTLARAAGAYGMVGGQVIDLESEGKKIAVEVLEKMDEGKTVALIRAACEMGCILGGGEAMRGAAVEYAQAVGLVFQIVDDILDVEGDTATLGKQVGSDSANEKCTYVSLLGLERAKELSQELTKRAVKSLEAFPGDTSYLRELAERLAVRRS